jgi:hypothetical protein
MLIFAVVGPAFFFFFLFFFLVSIYIYYPVELCCASAWDDLPMIPLEWIIALSYVFSLASTKSLRRWLYQYRQGISRGTGIPGSTARVGRMPDGEWL